MRSRGEGGRWQAGQSGNPRGRKPVSAVARLIEAAEKAGAEILIRVPAANDETPPVPPVAA